MATIRRATVVKGDGRQLWKQLIADPNGWPTWLTPLKGLEETAKSPVEAGSSFGARIGNVSGKIKVVEANEGEVLRWKAGPGPLLAMGMSMRGTLEFTGKEGDTNVALTMKSPPMMGPMMRMMTGLNPKDEMTHTIKRIKELAELGDAA